MASAFDTSLLPEHPAGNASNARPNSNPSFAHGGLLEADRHEENLPRSWHPSPARSDEEGTEDEEVKLNCLGGLKAYEDSDMSSDEDRSDADISDDDSDGGSPVEKVMKRSDVGVVRFVSRKVDSDGSGTEIKRPEPLMFRVDPALDEDDDADSGIHDRSETESSEDDATLDDEENDSAASDTEKSAVDDDEDASLESVSSSEDESLVSGEYVEAEMDEGERDEPESDVLSLPQDTFDHFDDPAELTEIEFALSTEEEGSGKPSPLSHAKRVLSSSALLGPSMLSSDAIMESPKKMRRIPGAEAERGEPSSLPPLHLGPAAEDATDAGNESRVSSESDLEQEDQQLREELQDSASEDDRTSTPVPLLTPPASPVHMDGDSVPVIACEWPSNLTVDIALTSAADLRPPSPSSLQTWEQQEEERLLESKLGVKGASSSLTPLIRGISVNLD